MIPLNPNFSLFPTLSPIMIQLNSLQLQHQAGEFYTLNFQRLHFTLIDAPDLKYLKQFSKSSQLELGKTEVRMQIGWLMNYAHFFKETNYVLMTQYQEILLLPYLFRKFPHIKIIATSLMYQLARIYLLAFQEKIKDVDATSANLTYDEEMNVIDAYQRKYDIDISKNPSIFTLKQAEEMLKSVVRVNYYQVYDTERGVSLIAHPSGKNNGSCFWQLQSQINKEKILMINDISQHQWRTCQSYNLQRLQNSQQQRSFDHIIFTRRGLANLKQEGQEARITEYFAKLASNMNNSISTIVVLPDETTVIDLIPRISFQPEGRCQSAFFSHSSFHDFTNYCNSYVDYLSDHFKNIIFSESPDYPLIHYSRFKEKGLIHTSGLEETAIKRRLPVREVVLQSSPFLLFVKSYEHYLQTEDLSSVYENVKSEELEISFENCFGRNQYQKFVSCFPKAKIFGFGVENLPRLTSLGFNSRQVIGEMTRPYFISAANLTTNSMHKFTLVNNQLQLKPFNRDIFILPKGFLDQIFNEMINKGFTIILKDKTTIRTAKTSINLTESYELKLISSHIEQLLLIERILTSLITSRTVPP